jgi:NAD(P)H-dependent FMN reductase
MKRLLVNGSPRGAKSNSRLICGWLAEGYAGAGAEAPEILDVVPAKGVETLRAAFLAADEAIIVFPLYTDSVPGIVKNFIDSLEGADPARLKGKRLGWVVQSGFPESVHSEAVAAYLKSLSARLGCSFLGVLIKGNGEGLRLMPASSTAKLKNQFMAAVKSVERGGVFPPDIIERMARPRHFGFLGKLVMAIMSVTGLQNLYFDVMLKKHGAMAHSFDTPYA